MDSYMGDGSTFFYDTAIPESTRCKLRENFEMAIHKFEGMMFPGDNELLLSSFPAGPPGCNSFYNDYSCPKLSLESTCLPNFAIEAPIGSSMTPIYPNIVQNAASSSCDGSEFSFVRPDEIFSHSTSPASMGLLFRDDSIDTDLDNFHTFQDPDASSPLSHASPLTSSSMPSECLEPASYDKYCPQPFPEVKLERGVSPISPGALRSQKDRFLVQARDSNMTYKEIKERGGFSEAESTLRGRYRALTKEKEARVRKPAWSHVDVSYYSIYQY